MEEYHGGRFSVIYYTATNAWEVGDDLYDELSHLGFNVPVDAIDKFESGWHQKQLVPYPG